MKNFNLVIPKSLNTGRPSYSRSLHPSEENIQHFKTWFFCPPGSRSGSSPPKSIRIQIQIGIRNTGLLCLTENCLARVLIGVGQVCMVLLNPYKILLSKYRETVSCIVVNNFIQVDFGEARLLSGLLMQGIRRDQVWVQAFQVLAMYCTSK
jgi:hypothetical protein